MNASEPPDPAPPAHADDVLSVKSTYMASKKLPYLTLISLVVLSFESPLSIPTCPPASCPNHADQGNEEVVGDIDGCAVVGSDVVGIIVVGATLVTAVVGAVVVRDEVVEKLVAGDVVVGAILGREVVG